MKRGILVAIFTAFVFAAGYSSRVWSERHRPLPPPPVRFGAEFAHSRPNGAPESIRHDQPLNRAELIARIEALRPQLDAFRAKMDVITAEFGKGMDDILTPEQRTLRAEHLKHVRDGRAQEEADPEPLSDSQITSMLREQPAETIMGDIVIPLRLDMLTHAYRLDDDQRERVRALLKVRREEILELVDSSPPPSVTLSRLALMVQRLNQSGASAAPSQSK